MNDDRFQQHLVLSAIAQGAHTLEKIARTCGGLYPLELCSVIETLIQNNKVSVSRGRYHLLSTEKAGGDSMHARNLGFYDAELPNPHPHDYDWRFDTATSQRLARMAIHESAPNGTVLLLGTPSILVEPVYSQNAPRTILIDWSKEMIDYLTRFHLPDSFYLVKHDVLADQFRLANADIKVVVADPPWYPEYYTAFLAQAAAVAEVGARIVVCLLPPNTRPGAVRDRWEIFETACKLSLHIVSIETGAIRYKTPPFERASLLSTSLVINENWRIGDLVTFAKIDHPSWEVITEVMASATSMAVDKGEWAEILFDRDKVKLRGPFEDYLEKPELLSIENDDTLPTVSRRYKGRESIDLWLCNNRVFAVLGKAAFLAALHNLAGRPLPEKLQQVPEAYLERARELLVHRAGIVGFQTDKVWKVTERDREHRLISSGYPARVGT